MRKLLLFFAMLCVSVGTQAAITITTAPETWIGGTTYNGYGIYGAKAGEIAQLLNGTYKGTVNWNGASLSALQSAALIKVGSTSAPNVLNDDDLESLELLSGARFLDIDGSTLAEGANIAKIKAGSNIEAVTLPNQLTKEQVNAAGASLKACNANFGSCMSLDAEMEEKEVTTYTYTDLCSSEEVEYTGEVTGTEGNYKGTIPTLTRDVTLISNNSTFSYENTKFPGDVVSLTVEQVRNADGTYKTTWTPESLKVALTQSDNPTRKYYYKLSDGTLIEIPSNKLYNVNMETGYVNAENWGMNEVDSRIPNPLTAGTQLIVETEHNYTYTYTLWNGEYDGPTYTCPAEDVKGGAGAYYCELANPGNHYSFPITANYAYSYSYVGTDCNVVTVENSPTYPGETIELEYNQTVDLTATTQTVNMPKEGGNTTVVAYVNTPGTLYQATSLDNYDVEVADALIISGNINNADISVHEGAGDPNASQNDDDAFTSTGAIPAFYVNHKQATIKSVDMSDAKIADYKHLRVLNAYGANLESVVFPKTVTRIPNYCCYSMGNSGNQNLSEIVFPTEAATLEIGDYAFHHCAVTSLLFPSSTTSVGNYAFATSPNMTDVEMQGLTNNCTFGNNVFDACGALKHVTLSEKTQNIGDNMFNQCGLLESIRIPTTCKTIGERAFQECYSIHEITIPEGVELIKVNAFELSGLTDIYVMATSPDKVPKIYAQDPIKGQEGGPSTFSYQRTTGYNTVPNKTADEWGSADYDEVMSWYQEEQSGPKGLGTGRALLALHYPESMKPFYEAIDITEVYTADQLAQFTANGLVNYFTPNQYLDFVTDATLKAQVQGDITNRIVRDGVVTNEEADRLQDAQGQEIQLLYLPQTYAIDPYHNGSNPKQGPDADNRYYPAQSDMVVRMVAGATGVNSGGTDGVASQWGWRQFPLSSSIEEIGEIPFEKEYDDTWYTMCFPWQMIDNQLFSAFNQKLEIVEFKGAEVFQDPEDEYNYNLVFHFDEVAKAYYTDSEGVEYDRVRDGNKVDGAGHNLYIYTSKDGKNTVVSCPDEVLASGYDPKTASESVKEAYGKYLSIQNVMVKPGHPYMIHPSIGAAPGNPATVYINGVKKIVPGEGLYQSYATLADVAESQKVEYTVTSKEAGSTAEAEAWKNPVTLKGGKYTFIGNINDAVEKDGKSDNGVQDMPTENGPVYFLGVKPGTNYPQYFKKAKGKGKGKWSQYSAIIVPDADAIANVEGLDGMSVASGTNSAKGFDVAFGEWEIVDEDQMATVIDKAVADGEEKNEPAKIQHMNVVYNIKGQVVRSNSSSVEGLPKGLYIVNGKKYLVK